MGQETKIKVLACSPRFGITPPANLLDLYAAADIPETETFGSTPFAIPGLRRLKENNNRDRAYPILQKFASSAAHVAGRRLVASETCTWLREHFKVALSQAKPEIDQLFTSGINHIFYHGQAYSPQDAPWPGWLFYAASHFEPENTLWHDLPQLNQYVARCQSILQSGTPANDLLLYWPIDDLRHNVDTELVQRYTVHSVGLGAHGLGAARPRSTGPDSRTVHARVDRTVAWSAALLSDTVEDAAWRSMGDLQLVHSMMKPLAALLLPRRATP